MFQILSLPAKIYLFLHLLLLLLWLTEPLEIRGLLAEWTQWSLEWFNYFIIGYRIVLAISRSTDLLSFTKTFVKMFQSSPNMVWRFLFFFYILLTQSVVLEEWIAWSIRWFPYVVIFHRFFLDVIRCYFSRSRRSVSVKAVDWPSLPPEILLAVAKRLHRCGDFAAFRGVCRSWRFAAPAKDFVPTKQILPRLLLPDDTESGQFRKLYSLTRLEVRGVPLPEVNGGERCFSSKGWLLIAHDNLQVKVLHPVSGVRIPMASLATAKDFSTLETFGIITQKMVRKMVLSSSPSDSKNFTVAAIIMNLVAVSRRGDDRWRCVGGRDDCCSDVIFDRGELYCLYRDGRVSVVDVSGRSFTVRRVFSVPYTAVQHLTATGEIVVRRMHAHLVSSWGGLLIAFRDYKYDLQGDGCSTYGFSILGLDRRNGDCFEVHDLGDRALFVGDNSSFSVKPSTSSCGCRRNCIYFADDRIRCMLEYWKPCLPGKNDALLGKDMGIYDLRGGSIQKHFSGQSFSNITPPLWVEFSLA